MSGAEAISLRLRSVTVLQCCSFKDKSTELGQCYSAAVLNARVDKWDSATVLQC